MFDAMKARMKDAFNPISVEDYIQLELREVMAETKACLLSNYKIATNCNLSEIRDHLINNNIAIDPRAADDPVIREAIEKKIDSVLSSWKELQEFTPQQWEEHFNNELEEEKSRYIKRIKNMSEEDKKYYELCAKHYYYDSYVKCPIYRVNGREYIPEEMENEFDLTMESLKSSAKRR